MDLTTNQTEASNAFNSTAVARTGQWGLCLALLALLGVFMIGMGLVVCINNVNSIGERVNRLEMVDANNSVKAE